MARSSKARTDSAGSLAFGLMLMTFGTLMLLGQFDVYDLRPWWKYWPLGLVYLGVAKWLSADRRTLTDGLGLVAAGVALLAHNLDILRLSQSWPLFLVVGGASIVAEAFGERRDTAVRSSPAEEAHHDR